MEVGIGLYGKGYNQWSLVNASEEWNRLRRESKLRGISPREVQNSEKISTESKEVRPTIEEAVKGWMKGNPEWSKKTRLDYIQQQELF